VTFNPTGLVDRRGAGPQAWLQVVKTVLYLAVPIGAVLLPYQGFVLLRGATAPKVVMAFAAIAWGVGAVAILFHAFNWFVERLPAAWNARLQPYGFVGPAIALLLWFLALPAVRTFYVSLFGRNGPPSVLLSVLLTSPTQYFGAYAAEFRGLDDYIAVLTERLVLPLSIPALASFAIFQFLWVWNDYLVASIILGPDPNTRVVTMKLASIIVGDRGQDWHLLTSGAFMSMIVPLMVFFALQRHFVRGLLAGSVKG
jgi:hypothetical protein